MNQVKKFLFLMFLTLATFSSGQNAFANTVRYSIPNIIIDIKNQPLENQSLTYPIVIISGQTYYPLTWELSKVLGYDAHFSNNRVLHLNTRFTSVNESIPLKGVGKSLLSSTAVPVTYPVLLDGSPLKTDFPLYNIGGITYLAISDQHALIKPKTQVQSSKYSTFDILDKSLLIRNQGTESTCWAFAANTIFEIAIALDTGEYYDFSETHLIENAPIPSSVQSGGNFNISSMYYLNGSGPISTSGDQDFALLGYRVDSNDISKTKDAIKKYGSVLTSIYLDEEDLTVYNEEHAAYYNPSTRKPRTHELVLVGWDDHYDRSRFISQPKRNGAFIALNSFGNSWGDEGLLYISYEDVHVLSETYSIAQYERKTAPFKIYFYDKTGLTHYESYNNLKSVFGISNFNKAANEQLKRVSFFASSDVTDVLIHYGSDAFNGNVGSPKHTYKIEYPGYHTVTLPKSFPVKNDFWVGIEFKGISSFIVPIEAPYPGINYPVSANRNEGFIGTNQSFEDLTTIRKNASIAIRAITSIEE